MLWPSFLEKTWAAAVTPWRQGYLPMSARTFGLYLTKISCRLSNTCISYILCQHACRVRHTNTHFLYGPCFLLLSLVIFATSLLARAIACNWIDSDKSPLGLGRPSFGLIFRCFNCSLWKMFRVFNFRKPIAHLKIFNAEIFLSYGSLRHFWKLLDFCVWISFEICLNCCLNSYVFFLCFKINFEQYVK